MSTIQTLSDELKKAGIKVSPATIKKLFDNEYEQIAHLREDSMTMEEFMSMGIRGRSAKMLVKHFGANSSSAGNTGGNILDLMKNDPEAFTWRKIQHLEPAMVKQFVDDFFIDTTNRRRPGYSFMETVVKGSYKNPVAKLQGEVSQKGTLKLVLSLIKGNARFDRGLFVVGPREKYVTVSLADMHTKLMRIDPLDPNGGYLSDGADGEGFRGVQFYTRNGRFVLSKEVQEFLALAYANGELDKTKAIKIADDIRGKEKRVSIDDLRWVLEQTFDQVSVTGNMKMPSLEGDPKNTPRRHQQQQRQNMRQQSQPSEDTSFSITPQKLTQIIAGYYSLGEIKTLAYNWVDPEDLEGQTKQSLARSLVQFCQRHQKINYLATQVYVDRPHAFQ